MKRKPAKKTAKASKRPAAEVVEEFGTLLRIFYMRDGERYVHNFPAGDRPDIQAVRLSADPVKTTYTLRISPVRMERV